MAAPFPHTELSRTTISLFFSGKMAGETATMLTPQDSPSFTARHARFSLVRATITTALTALLLTIGTTGAPAQPGPEVVGFENFDRTGINTLGEMISGEDAIAYWQGRTAIVAWHGNRLVSVPEPPGSQPGADVRVRVIDMRDMSILANNDDAWLEDNGYITVMGTNAGGFNSHGYFKTGDLLFIGPYCTGPNYWENCNDVAPLDRQYADAFMIAPPEDPRQRIGSSDLVRTYVQDEYGMAVGAINRSGSQSPWGAEMFWTYDAPSGDTFIAVRRPPHLRIYDWSNNGVIIPDEAVRAQWDVLGDTGVTGFPFIMGNLLIYAADQSGTGVAVYDISDLSNPVLLDVLKEENPGGYWPEIYGHYIFFPRRDGEGGVGSDAGYMIVDFSDPTDLQVVADVNVPGSNQYVTFQDEYAFMNNYKIDMRTFEVVLELDTSEPGVDASQFALPVGNLVITGGYGTDGPGLRVWVHQLEADTRSPFVAYHIPRPDQTNYSVDCPITLSIPETLRTETIVDGVSLIVQPVGGSPIPIWHAFGQGKLLTVTPQEPFEANTTYEVILTSAIEDAAGNGLEPYTFRFSTGAGLAGGNTPPSIGEITTNPATGTPAASLDFAWSGTDAELDDIEYRIDFGDGSPRTAWSTATGASHTYDDEGHYQVTVQARDTNGGVSARSRKLLVANPPADPGATASSHLAFDGASDRVYVVNPDNDTVTALTASTMSRVWEQPVGANPAGVAVAADGDLWVVNRDDDTVSIVDDATGSTLETLPLDYGTRPVAIAPVPGTTRMLVSGEGSQSLHRFDTSTRTADGVVSLGPSPRAIAVTADGSRALVTRFLSNQYYGQVYDVALDGDMALTRTIRLRRDHSTDGSASSRGVPNYLAGIAIDPDGAYAWVVGKKDNTTRGTFTHPTLPLGQDNTVRAMMMLVDLATNSEDTDLRLDIDNSESPSAMAFSPMGDYAFFTLQGNAEVGVVDVFDHMRVETAGTVHARWDTGIAPQAVVVDGATGRLFVHDFMDRSVSMLDASAFLSTGSPNIVRTTAQAVAAERFQEDIFRGKQIFYHASDPRMSPEGYISCATCHIGGGHDGRTWDFTDRGEGFRNTTDLRGRSGMGHGLVHWSANFDEIQDFENDIRNAFGGSGFLKDSEFKATSDTMGTPKAGLDADLDALAAYVRSLGPTDLPRSPHRNADGSLTDAATRGAAVFAAHGCATCHVPATDYTDFTVHDVGTTNFASGGRLGGALPGIDTPTLLGLHDSAPYFHNGSARTLEEVFTTTGGELVQAESGTVGGSSAIEDVPWLPMKEWHQGEFVAFYWHDAGAGQQPGSLTIDGVNVSTPGGGEGYVEIRYSSGGGTNTNITPNGGAAVPIFTADTGNVPGWMANEWRTIRAPITYQQGNNTIVFSDAGGGDIRLDDFVFSTPDHAAAASAHVRDFAPGELDDLVAYLLSLDTTDAARPDVTVRRDAVVIVNGGTDEVTASGGATTVDLTYTIENDGPGPLNLGRIRAAAGTGASQVEVLAQPANHVLAGGATQLQLRITLGGAVDEADASVGGWSDAPAAETNANTLGWTVAVTVDGGATVTSTVWLAF